MSDFTPPRLAVLTSHSAAGIERLLEDANRGTLYQLAAVISTETAVAEGEAIERAGVPLILEPLRSWQQERSLPLRNLKARTDYDVEIAGILDRLGVTHVILTGYRYILGEPLLSAFPQRIIALHDGDLTVQDAHGTRLLAGLHAVREAVFSGASQTRCSAYLVTREVGQGPLLLLSGAYPVASIATDARAWGDADLLTAYADSHGRWMLRSAAGDMLLRVAQMISAGTLQVVGDVVWVDGVPGPCRMGEAPSTCFERNIDSGIPASCPFITK